MTLREPNWPGRPARGLSGESRNSVKRFVALGLEGLRACASVARALAPPQKRFSALFALAAFLCFGLPASAWAAEIPPLHSDEPPDFTADLVLSLDGEGHPAMGVSVTIPYQGLQWVQVKAPKAELRFAADLEVAVSFRPRKGGPLLGDVWEHRLVVGTFEVSRSPRAATIERRK